MNYTRSFWGVFWGI